MIIANPPFTKSPFVNSRRKTGELANYSAAFFDVEMQR